ncbi:GGDEF domain-containing protein [Allosaccharopolyspora coralli]|uniref:GGDEF domain-containing protein n=1 Tax=Allosaccharopolyspora coralli TaxID=2665642 RepID=UPI001E2A9795|nr:diguanylate cyclase [Allosaccharopolyspora coralli]
MRSLLDSGRVDECQEGFEELICPAPGVVDDDWPRSTVLVHRALMAWRLGRISLALELAAEGWAELDRDEPSGPAAAHTLSMLGYLLEGHRTSALGLLSLAVEVARESGDESALAHCLLREATALVARALHVDALSMQCYEQALDRFDEALRRGDDGPVTRRALSGSARALLGIGQADEAHRRAKSALEQSIAEQDVFCSATAYWALGSIHREAGDLELARTKTSRALEAGERIRDTLLVMQFSDDLAAICHELGDSVGEAEALRRTVNASSVTVSTLQEGLGQALEQRRVAVQAQQLASAAQEAATRDPLTGLTNRLGLERQAPELLEQTAAQGRVPWLILIDVDWFKGVNDESGHAAGDVTLQEVAHLLRSETRSRDLLIRWAGDEFIVLLLDPDNAGADAGALVAERIRAAVDSHDWRLAVGATAQPPTVSIGVAAGPAHLDSLFAAADAALYRAKRAGRNRVEIDHSAHDNAITSP